MGKCVKEAFQNRFSFISVALLFGFCSGYLNKTPQMQDPEIFVICESISFGSCLRQPAFTDQSNTSREDQWAIFWYISTKHNWIKIRSSPQWSILMISIVCIHDYKNFSLFLSRSDELDIWGPYKTNDGIYWFALGGRIALESTDWEKAT